jgi:hypothetical protein
MEETDMLRSKERATFLLLPSSVATDHAQLGRVVTNIYAPGHDYAPQIPHYPDIRGLESEPVVQHEARSIFKHEQYASVRDQLSDLLNIDFSRDSPDDIQWKSGTLTTYSLLNHTTYFAASKKNRDVKAFIDKAWNPPDRRDRKDVFLIVGIKEWTYTTVQTVRSSQKAVPAATKVPVEEAAQLPTTTLDISHEAKAAGEEHVEHSEQYKANLVFAVQYRRIRKPAKGAMILEPAQRLGPSVFSGNESDHGKTDIASDQETVAYFELQDIDEEFLEDDGEYARVDLGDDDLLYLRGKHEDGNKDQLC